MEQAISMFIHEYIVYTVVVVVIIVGSIVPDYELSVKDLKSTSYDRVVYVGPSKTTPKNIDREIICRLVYAALRHQLGSQMC